MSDPTIIPYISIDDLVPDFVPAETFRMLTSDLGSAGSDIDFVRFVLNRQGTIDDSLRGAGYALPLPVPIPADVREITIAFVLYGLYLRRPGGPPKHVTDEYNLKLKRLDLIRNGQMSLGGVPKIAKTDSLGIAANLTEDDIEMSKKHIDEAGFPVPSFGLGQRGLGSLK